MKYLYLLLFFPLITFSQDEDSSKYSKVIQAEGLSAEEIFSKINISVANIFNSAEDVIQLKDSESKRLVIKAKAEIVVPNQNRHLYPNNKYMNVEVKYLHDYTLNIACRDGRYKLEIDYQRGQYLASPTQYSSGGWQPAPYAATMNPSAEYIKASLFYWEEEFQKPLWKLIGKKKKQNLLSNIPNDLRIYSDNLIEYSNLLFKTLDKGLSVAPNKDDDW